MNILKFASIYYKLANEHKLYKTAASVETIKWARGVVDKAFEQVMGKKPSVAEAQIVMAVSQLESGYGQGWKKGKGSHNWGAVQVPTKLQGKVPSFSHGDSSAEGKYVTEFRVYPDDVAGAADVVKLLFKSNMKQREPDPNRKQRAIGSNVDGPNRGELISKACTTGNILEFSKAMWFTIYYEGFGENYKVRIDNHAKTIKKNIDQISSALKEPTPWSLSAGNYLPITSNQEIINKLIKLFPFAVGITNKNETTTTAINTNTITNDNNSDNDLLNFLWN